MRAIILALLAELGGAGGQVEPPTKTVENSTANIPRNVFSCWWNEGGAGGAHAIPSHLLHLPKTEVEQDQVSDFTCVTPASPVLNENEREVFYALEERAAILEFEAGLPRSEAEAAALETAVVKGEVSDSLRLALLAAGWPPHH